MYTRILAAIAIGLATALAAPAQTVESGPKTYAAGITQVPAAGEASTLSTSGSVAVPNGATVQYVATGSINLEPGFSVTGGGVFSAQIKQAQTITFAAIPNHYTTDVPFGLAATASSGLPVTYAITSGPATINGSIVTVTGAGTVIVTATQPGDAIFAAAQPVSQSFTVNLAPQTINFPAISNHVYGDAPFNPIASATSGLPVTLTVMSGPATIANGAVTLTAPGSVTIQATQLGSAAFAAATPVSQTFTVAAPPGYVTVTVQNGTAAAPGGVSGNAIALSASIPAGQYFTGWVVVSGLGSFSDISAPSTTFTLGSTDATVQATYSATAPTYGITWNEVDLPTNLTVVDMNDGASIVRYSAVVTNSGTAPWGPSTYISVSQSGNGWVADSGVSWYSAGGVPPGGKVELSFTMWQPSTAGAYTYTFTVGPQLYSTTGAFGTFYKSVYVQPAGGASRPEFFSLQYGCGLFTQPGTVGSPYYLNPAATNSPTSYSCTGTLPPGISLDTSTGILSGTPTQAGTYAVTLSATNSSGIGTASVLITVYPSVSYSLTVNNGTGSTSAMTVGSVAPITANAPVAGQIFNGWTVLSGPGTVTNPDSPSTTLTLTSPGNTVVQANYITGNSLTVVNGTSTPLGGVSGAAVTITANPDANGQMFTNWTTASAGTIADPSAITTTFTMGNAAATVQANFVPGYRLLTEEGATASAPGGLPGATINLTAPPTPSGNAFAGWYGNGPGYVLGSQYTMGAGAAWIEPVFWPNSSGQPVMSYLNTATPSVDYNQPFTLVAQAVDSHGTLTEQRVDYSLDGGVTWVIGTTGANTDWSTTGGGPTPTQPAPYVWQFNPQFTFGSPGTVVFRMVGIESQYMTSTYSYCVVHVLNQAYVAPPVITPQSATAIGSFGNPFNYTITASNTDPNSTYGLSGTLPPGLSFNSSNGVISGTPTDTSTWTVTVSATNAGGTGTGQLAITIQSSSTVLPPGTPTASPPSAVTTNSFSAEWSAVGTASGYQIDVSTDSSFGSYVSGYQNLDVGNVTSASVTGLASGLTYYYRVRAYNQGGASGNSGTITVPLGSIPMFTAQPQAQSTIAGGSATFAVAATASPAPTFQWQRMAAGTSTWTTLSDNSTYAGTTTATLTISGVTTAMNGDQFQVVATSSGASTTSSVVNLTVSAGQQTDDPQNPKNQLNIHIPF